MREEHKMEKDIDILIKDDLPPKKWTQRRVGGNISTDS